MARARRSFEKAAGGSDAKVSRQQASQLLDVHLADARERRRREAQPARRPAEWQTSCREPWSGGRSGRRGDDPVDRVRSFLARPLDREAPFAKPRQSRARRMRQPACRFDQARPTSRPSSRRASRSPAPASSRRAATLRRRSVDSSRRKRRRDRFSAVEASCSLRWLVARTRCFEPHVLLHPDRIPAGARDHQADRTIVFTLPPDGHAGL